MKRIIVALAAVAVLGSTVRDARALGAYAVWWHPSDTDNDGFGFGLRETIPLLPVLDLDTRAAYVTFSDSDLKIYPLEAVGIVKLGLLYGGLGVGYYIFDPKEGDAENAFGWHVLAGVRLALGGVGVFGEIKWTQLSADIKNVDVNLKDVPTSIDADGIGFNAGITFGI